MPAGKTREEYNEYMREYMKARIAKRRAEAVKQLGGKCVKCGSSENLEFDHIDRDSKDPRAGGHGKGSMWTFSEKRFQAELVKCQLLCHDCHLAKTMTENLRLGIAVLHGGGLTGKRNCYCSLCKPLKEVYNMGKRKAKQVSCTTITSLHPATSTAEDSPFKRHSSEFDSQAGYSN